MKVGADIPLQYRIDRGASQSGVADAYVGEGGGAPVSPPELTDPDLYSAIVTAAD
jgi:hypothetical protein